MAAEIQPYNPVFVNWLRNYRATLGLDLACRYSDDWDEDLPDVCPQCGERCELDGDPVCYECKHDKSRGKESEAGEGETCEMCGGSGEIYVMRPNTWYGAVEVPITCECRFPTLIPYNVQMLVIEELSGLNWV